MINDECSMIEGDNSFLKTLHYLSLDVVVGAVASSWMFWKIPDGNGEVNLPSILILGICTWIIYIFDRLLDNLKYEPFLSDIESLLRKTSFNPNLMRSQVFVIDEIIKMAEQKVLTNKNKNKVIIKGFESKPFCETFLKKSSLNFK